MPKAKPKKTVKKAAKATPAKVKTNPKKKKHRPLTQRQIQLANNLRKTGNVVEAGRMCNPPYSADSVSYNAVARLRKHPDVKEAFLRNERLAIDSVVDYHADLIEATRIVGYITQYASDKDGILLRVPAGMSISNDFVEVPDWHARAKGIQLFYKIRGDMVDRVKIEEESSDQESIERIAGTMKSQGKTYRSVRTHFKHLGILLPAPAPEWWVEL